MDDHTDYKAMRDAGATALEVCVAALQRKEGGASLVQLLKNLFNLTFEEACQVLKEGVALHPSPPIEGYFQLFVIDPRSRAVVTLAGIDEFRPLDALRPIMVRPPTVERATFLSWGRVTRSELEALLHAGYLDDEDELTLYPPEATIWSLSYTKKRLG
jgi:hypothetical protein